MHKKPNMRQICMCSCACVYAHIGVQLSDEVLRRMRESQGSVSAKTLHSSPDKPLQSMSLSHKHPTGRPTLAVNMSTYFDDQYAVAL